MLVDGDGVGENNKKFLEATMLLVFICSIISNHVNEK